MNDPDGEKINMQKSNRIVADQLFYAAAFIIALILRLLRLSQVPPTDSEAGLALQALELARGSLEGSLAGQPGYLLPTTALFAIFGAGNAAARLIPALAGAGLVWIPAVFRKELGRPAAVFAAFGIALDPGLSALSRQASGFTWAVIFGLLAWAGLRHRKGLLGGISLGLAVLAGDHFWQGLLGAGLGYVLFRLFSGRVSRQAGKEETPRQSTSDFWKKAIPAALASLVLGGTMFFFIPRGISAAGSGLVEFVSGWLGGGEGSSRPLLLLALAVYETFGLIFALIRVIRVIFSREKKPTDLALIAWWLAALLIGLLNPAGGEVRLGWALLPMWALAARWLADSIPTKDLRQRLIAAIQSIVLFGLAVFAWLNLLGAIDPARSPDEIRIRWVAALGALFLAGASLLLISWGWSKSAAAFGALWATTALLALWNISALFSASGLGRNPEEQLWRSGPAALDQDLLLATIGDFSEWNSGFRHTIDLAVVQVSSPALKWALRDFTAVDYYDVTPLGASPSLVLTPDRPSPDLAATYRGQDFQWMSTPAWDNLLPMEWFKWAVFKTAPMNSEKLVLWVRTDLFPGAAPEQE